MPGLRSLVARRRSSLASPPYVSSTSNLPLNLSDAYVSDGKGQKSESSSCQTPEEVTANGEEASQDDDGGGGGEGDGGGGGDDGDVNSHSSDNGDCQAPQQTNDSNDVNQTQENTDVENVESDRSNALSAADNEELNQCHEPGDREINELDRAGNVSNVSCESVNKNNEPTDVEHVENANTQESSNSKHPSVSELSNMSKVSLEEKEKNSEDIHVSNEDEQEILCVNADCEKHDEGTTDRDAEKSNEQNVSDANNEKIIDKEGSENKETTNVDHIVNNSNSDINIIDGEEVGVIHPLEKKDDNLNQSNCSNTPNEKEVAPHDENGEASSECLSIADSKNQKLNNDTCVSGKQISNTEQCSKSELLTIKEKFCGGANRFVKKSAMEIESTLASRGVTIVRRMVDNVETVGRIKNETKQATNMAAVVKNGSVITANPQITAPSGNFSSQSNSRLSLANNVFKGFASVSIQSGSSVRHFSEGLMSRSVSKDIYKPINSRGTLVQGGSKALSNLKKCTQLNFRGIPIHPNSKYTPHTNSNLRSLGLNDRGFKLDTTLKGLNLHTAKGFTAHSNPRGPSFQNRLGGTAMQANLRANAMPIDSSGLHGYLNKGSMRYASPRGPTIKPNSTGQSPHSKSTILNPHIRPVTSQQSRSVGNMSQVRSLGIPNRSKSVDVSLLSKVTEVSSQPRLEMSPCAKSRTMAPRAPSTTMSPQSRPNVMSPNRPNVMSPQSQSAKMSPQSKSIDVSPQSRTIDLLSQNKSNEVDVSLHSKTGDASPKSRSVGTVLPLQSRSADLSPLSISDQISPQSINKVNHTGIHPHSRYTGMSPQSLMTDLSPQSRSSGLPPHSVSAVHATQSVSTTSTRPSPQMNLMGVSAHSSTIGPLPESNDETIPPHSSSGGLLSQTNSLGVPSHMVTSGLPHMVNSDRFSASSSSSGFPVSSGFLGSSSTDQFPAYNNSGEFSPHTNTTEFPSELSSGGFNMHSSSGGFSTQSNLIGFTTQTNSCGFPQHSNSGDYSPHNPGGIIGQTNSEGFSAHSSCGSFPVAMNSGGYPAHSSTGQYNTQNNAGEFRENSTDMMMYSASRDFPMHPNSREFSSYSSSNNMPNNMQNCSQGMPLPSNTGNPSINPIVGDQYSQSNYGESLAHPTYREAPLHSRVSPGEVPVLPDFRESSLRHAYRDSSLPPSYNNYRDPGSQDNSRGSQSHNYRGMPLHSNMGELQAHVNTRAQNSHTSFKEQSEPAGYRGQDILSNYMESSAIPNFRDTLDLGNCTEQPLNNYRQTVNHSSPREQVLPSFGESVTHPSPGDQVIPSPREQMLPPYGEPVGHSSPREQALPGFRESVNHASPRDQVLPCFQETVSHTSPREQVLPCFQETVSHTSPREQVLPSFRVNGRHSSPREQILPSFQETLNDTNSKQPYLPTFREPDNYNTSFRESLNHNSSCELSGNPNSGDLLSYGTSCRHPSNSVQADKPRADNSYRESNTIPNFRINSQHMVLEEPSVDLKFREENLVNTYNESSALPSFTESFEHNGSNEIQIKTESSSVGLSSFRDSSHYSTPRNVSDCGSFRESSFSPNSRSPVYANTRNSCASWHTGELPVYTDTGESPIYLCTNDSSDSQVRESAGICSRRESLVHSSSVYSSAHPDTCEDSNIKTRDLGFISSRDNFLLDKSLIPSTEESPVHADVGNSPGYSSIMDSVDHGLREAYHESRTETYGHPDTKPSVQSSEDLPQGPRDLPVNSTSINSLDHLSSVEETKLPNQESSVDINPNEFCETAVLSSPTSQPLSESPVHSKCITRTSPIDDSAILSPSCSDSLGSPEKHTSGISSTKSDSGASPSSQERIVIKMKLLHSELGSECNRQSRTENAGITELRMDSRNSVKYPMAKYTRWTIDSIINGREDICSEEGSDKVGKNEQKLVHDEINLKEDTTFSLAVSPKRTKRQKISEMCNESRETKLDTNKNLMKKTIRITIANPLRTRVSTTDNCVDIKLKESEHDSTILSCEIIPDEKNENVQPVTVNNVRRSCRLENESANQISMCSTRKLRDRHLKLPSPAPSIESCASSTSASRASCDSRRCSRSSDTSMSSVTSVFSESNDHSIVADMKKCSIVIKRIYATDNYSCYSSSLCDKKPVLNNRDVRPTRPKRKAAVEATLKCHKSLKSLDTNDAKTKLPQNGAFNARKNCVSVNEENKAPLNNIPQCSVLLYDVFMNRRINKMVCPGCSRHYDSTDSVQVNINKATISLLCSACQWLVVKDVHPREVDSMAPS